MTEKKITQAELDKKAQQLLEQKESEARMRTYQGPLAKIIIFLFKRFSILQASNLELYHQNTTLR